jgi:hypothetical protein
VNKTKHKLRKALKRRERIRQEKAATVRCELDAAKVNRWIKAHSENGTKPCLHVLKYEGQGDVITRHGLTAVGESQCPHCAALGIESTVSFDRIMPGFDDAGALIGHCAGCFERGIQIKRAEFWGVDDDQ